MVHMRGTAVPPPASPMGGRFPRPILVYPSLHPVQRSPIDTLASIGLLTPLRRLYPLAVRQSSALPTASSAFHLTVDTLAVQLTLPLAGCVVE